MRWPTKFPYTSINNINLDWIIKQVKKLTGIVDSIDPDLINAEIAQANANSAEAREAAQTAQATADGVAGTAAAAVATANAAAAAVADKQDAPAAAGTSGQVLGLDANLDPVWVNQSGGGGTSDYTQLNNKPSINSVPLIGNKTAADLSLATAAAVADAAQAASNAQDTADFAIQVLSNYPADTLPVMDGTAAAGSAAKVSRADHVHPSDTSRQPVITASGMLKGEGAGSISAATLGTDYGALAITVRLLAASWTNNQLTVNNAAFVTSGFAYIVAPVSASYDAYSEAGIYADDVTTAGAMVFHCTTPPAANLDVNIIRMVSA